LTGALLLLTAPVVGVAQTEIIGSLSNFDVHQGWFEYADNFELDFRGDIDPEDFRGYFPGWGTPPRFDNIVIGGIDVGAEALWLNRADPVPFCEWRHFGLDVNPALGAGGGGGGTLYASDDGGTLYTVNHTTGMATPVCGLPLPATEIEYNNVTNRAILQDVDGAFMHQEFDINTCAPLGPPFWNGRAFAGLEYVGSTLYGTGHLVGGGPSELHTINPATGGTVLIGPTGFGPISGLVYDPGSGTMYGVTGGGAPSLLVTINLGTGLATPVGPTGVTSLGGLAFGPDGNLYGIGNNADGGFFYRINPGTGAATLIGPTGHPGFTGLTLVGGGGLPSVQAYWTKINKVLQVPVPFQWWVVVDDSTVVDVLTFSETFDQGPVFIVREWAVSPFPIPLEELQFDATPVDWQFGDDFILEPGQTSELPIPIGPGVEAVLVRYTVSLLRGVPAPAVRFVTEAVLEPMRQQPSIRSVLVNFDLHNDIPQSAFDNFELDFFGDWLEPEMIVWWYDREDVDPPFFNAWGVDPLIRKFPPDLFPGMPGGLEVTWIDKYNPFEFCETYHFGLEFDPAVQAPQGGGVLYASDNMAQLYTVDHITGLATPTCTLPLPATEIEFDNLRFRGIVQDTDGGFQHQEFDINTCAPLGGGPWPNGAAFAGLEYVGNTLYGTGHLTGPGPSDLYTINPANGTTFRIGPTGQGPISGLTYDPGTGIMYGVTGGGTPSLLVNINLGTGFATVIGPTGTPPLGGLAFGPDGNLYGIGSTQEGGNFYRINPMNGSATLVGPTGFFGFTGLTLVRNLPSVQAYWTEIDTCQVPVPWQFWRALPDGPILDIIRLSETWWPPDSVEIVRQFVTIPFRIPLEDLTWPGTDNLEWYPEDGESVILAPGDDTVLKICLQEGDEAALVRYTVRPLPSPEIVARFVNEAMVLPDACDAPEVMPELRGTRFEQNMPNPFSDWTVLIYNLDRPSDVTISIYDVAGRRVGVLREGEKPAGLHTVRWDPSLSDGTRLAAGVYFAIMQVDGKRHERKMILTE
jgi:hypothetical protein